MANPINVLFKRGLHSNLPATTAAQDGVFYLTTDTNRLYVGQGTNLVELNKSITVISNANQLPEYTTDDSKEVKGSQVAAGQFYYINAGADSISGNILAVCSAINSQTHKITWTQVNPDTDHNDNDDTKVTSMTAVLSSTANDALNYTITLNQSTSHIGGGTDTLDPVSATLSIGKEALTTLAGVSVDIYNSAVSNSAVTISTTGSGHAGDGFTIAAGDNITLTSTAGESISIASKNTTYELNSAANSTNVVLTGKNGSTQASSNSIAFDAGTALKVSGTSAGHIQYSHDTVAHTTSTSTATASNNAEIAVIDSITVDAQGHVTAYNTKTVTAKNTTTTAVTVSAGTDNGNLTIKVKDSANGEVTSTGGDGILFHKITVDGTEVTKYNQQSLGSFYSASKVDQLISGLNAMTYKGTATATSQLPSSATAGNGIKIGDTYMVTTAGIGPDSNSRVGDLYIATGTETNGVITGAVTWTLVPAGDDPDTTYTFTVKSDGTIEADPSTSNQNVTVAKVTGGTAITANVSGSTITLNHDSVLTSSTGSYGVSSDTAPGYNGSFNVPYVTVNAQGHVTAIENKAVTLPASVNTTYTLSADTVSNEAVVKLTAGGSGSGFTSAPIVGDTTSIAVAVESSKIKVSHNQLLSNSATAGIKYGESTSATPAAGGTIKVPQIKVNAEGHVTEVGEQSITLPADKDTKFQLRPVEVTATSSNNFTQASSATATVIMSDTTSATSNKTTSPIVFTSDSLEFSKPASTTSVIKADIVWGSF